MERILEIFGRVGVGAAIRKAVAVLGKIVVWFGRLVAALLLLLVAVASWGHLFVSVYDFSEPQPFSGDRLYDPYEGVDFGQAKKAIMHFHTTRSDGHDEPEAIVGAYRDMEYEIISVADHDRITRARIDPVRELGTYEHGLNVFRFHNVVFGAEEPLFFQLPLWQGVSAREETLRRLSERFPIVVLNHPAGVRGLEPEQMERLSHYDYIEADRGMDRDIVPWDVALSAGHYSFVMAGDDLHDLGRRYAIGRAMTFVMTPSVGAADVIRALEAGHAYAVRMTDPPQVADSLYVPGVRSFDLAGDTLRVAFTDPAHIRFIGQGGAVLREAFSDEASYVVGAGDSYVRVEADFGAGSGAASVGAGAGGGAASVGGGATIYLNPVARYSAGSGFGGDGGSGDDGGFGRPRNAVYSAKDLPLTVLSVAGHAILILACLAGIVCLFFCRGKSRRVKRGSGVVL